jgi:hypothetical protein
MPSRSAQRKALLREIFIRTNGDLQSVVTLSDLATALNISLNDTKVIVLQLVEKNLLKKPYLFTNGDGLVSITMHGTEECEKEEKPFFQRWPSEHPVSFGFLMSIFTGLVMLILGRFIK